MKGDRFRNPQFTYAKLTRVFILKLKIKPSITVSGNDQRFI